MMNVLSGSAVVLCVLLSGTLEAQVAKPESASLMRYTVDLTQVQGDSFHVALEPGKLTAEDEFFEFAAFAPGVHSVLNFGRFVIQFHAWDQAGIELGSKKIGLNRWQITDPERVARITYEIDDTNGSEVEGGAVTPYAGTGIDEDYAVLNPLGVCGYFKHHLDREVSLRLKHDPEWLVGTPLKLHADGTYHAKSYHALGDSPFLLGALTTTGIYVGDIEIDIFVHASSLELNAEEVMFVAGDMLQAAEKFIGFAPVKRYVLLVDFMDRSFMLRNGIGGAGALEHSHSSFYALPAGGGALRSIAGIIAHEFMHILTPLHLRSTIIAEFDYSIATTDRQLWLYEGLTEWTSGILRLRGGILELEEYLDMMASKMFVNSRFRDDYSLARLSLEWSTSEGLTQYGNIYNLGALTSMMLDLRILELSGGSRGLREVFVDLIHKFGEARPFDDETFMAEFVEASYPEIAQFMQDHISEREPLGYLEAFGKMGIEFLPDGRGAGGSFKVLPDCSDKQLALRESWLSNLGG